MPVHPDSLETAQRQLEARGALATPARVRVLALLYGREANATHLALMDAARAEGRPLDKVTLYRVLDWLVAQGLAHSVTGSDRVRRFGAAGEAHAAHHAHAHFECDDCGRLFCLDTVDASAPALPPSFEAGRVDVTVHGRCAACASER